VATKADLKAWVVEALETLGGSGTVIQVTREVWRRHEHDLQASGDLFFTWQYDIRWAAQQLRDSGVLRPANGRRAGTPWMLA